MIIANVKVSDVCAKSRDCKPIPKGIAGARVQFEFSPEWEEMDKVIVFKGCYRVLGELQEDNAAILPQEVTRCPGQQVYVGVYGVNASGNLAIPTLWAELGMVRSSADPSGDPAADPEFAPWVDIRRDMGKLKDLQTQDKSSLVAAINEAYSRPGGNGGITVETDPTVPSWAKQPEPPKYTASDVDALPADTKIPVKTSDLTNDSGFITRLVADLANYYTKANTYSREEIDQRISAIPKFRISVVSTLPTEDISDTTIYLVPGGDSDDLYLEYIYVDGAWEILGSQRVDLTGYATENWVLGQLAAYAKSADIPTRPEDIGAQPAGNYLTEVPEGYAKTEDIPTVPVQSVNGKTGAVQLGAADVGARPASWMPTAQDVGALPSTYTPPNQTAEQVGADPKGTAASAVSQHNTDEDAHNDIRLELKAINDRLTAFFDSDDQTLDELSEIVAYITNNKTLIESITTSKVSVTDIINNLTTNVANKPLSAAQGVVLKGLIDTLSNSLSGYALKSAIPTKVSQLTNDSGYLTEHQDISGLLPRTELPTAINTALAQAKASGEFDGADGEPGKTPVRGVDYYTEADKLEMVSAVIAALPIYNGEVE